MAGLLKLQNIAWKTATVIAMLRMPSQWARFACCPRDAEGVELCPEGFESRPVSAVCALIPELISMPSSMAGQFRNAPAQKRGTSLVWGWLIPGLMTCKRCAWGWSAGRAVGRVRGVPGRFIPPAVQCERHPSGAGQRAAVSEGDGAQPARRLHPVPGLGCRRQWHDRQR